jgi:hypothetical protein
MSSFRLVRFLSCETEVLEREFCLLRFPFKVLILN